jgi:probable rRNA maturation factor
VTTKGSRKNARTASRRESGIVIIVDHDPWKKQPAALKLIRSAAGLAVASAAGSSATILLSDDARLRELNRQFRGSDEPTNVLAFPSTEPGYLGDVAIALGVVEREAREQRKSLSEHAAHLAVHGILHLKGYDHGTRPDRTAMERAETLILSRLGVPPPYSARPYTKAAKAVN